MQSQAEGPLSSQLAASVAADSRAINITRVGNSFYHHFLQHPLSSPASSPSPASPPLLHSLSGCAPFSAASGGARSLSFWSRAKSKESLQEGISGHSSNEQEGTYTEESSQFEPSSSCGLPGGEFESPSEHLPMAVDSIEAATAVHEACEAVEAASLLAAKDDSFFAAAYFIDAITALHHQAGLPWCVQAKSLFKRCYRGCISSIFKLLLRLISLCTLCLDILFRWGHGCRRA